MRLNQALRAQPGGLLELSAFLSRFSGKCCIPADWKKNSNSIGSSDPLFYVSAWGEGPLLVDGYEVVSDIP